MALLSPTNIGPGASAPPLAFRVCAWAAWSGGDIADAAPVPSLLRRRVSTLGQHALRLAWNITGSGEARFIASSRHGEFARSLAIMKAIADGEGVSPADFTLSVHHALIGLLSIARGNRRGHTAVAAGPESFCFGFLEAAAGLADNPAEPALLIHYDEKLPEPFAHFDDDTGPALALVVALAADGPGQAMTLAMKPTAAPGRSGAASAAAGFRDFMADPKARDFVLTGPRMTWTWSRYAAAG